MQSDTLVESLVNIILYQPYKRDLWFWYLLLYILTVNRIKLIVLICSLFLNNEFVSCVPDTVLVGMQRLKNIFPVFKQQSLARERQRGK